MTEAGSIRCPWWTNPLAITLLRAKGSFGGSLAELVLWFPFLPACLISAQDEEVRRMKRGGLAPRAGLVTELEGRSRLIVELHHSRVIFHQGDRAQFDLTLEWDGDAHLAGRKEARHIKSARLRSAGRRRKAAARNQINGFGWQMQSLAPALKFLQTHCIPPQLLVNHSLQGRKESRRPSTRRGPFTMKGGVPLW